MKKFFTILFLLMTFSLTAQSNKMIDQLLQAEKADFQISALLILQSAKIIANEGTSEDALEYLQESGWMKKEKSAGDTITLGETCYLIMKSYKMKGGLAWNINPTPRNASREMQFKGAIYDTDKSPYRLLSGDEVLNMISWIIDYSEEREILNETE